MPAFRFLTGRRPTAAVRDQQPPPPDPARQLAAQVVALLDHGVVVLDADERAVLVNPAAAAMGVLSGEHLVPTQLLAVARSATARDPASRTVDLPDSGRLGREPAALAVTATRLPGPEPATVLLLTDVTESRRLDAVRRDFVANVSHELKTPVGALTLLAEAVQDAADDPGAVHRFAGRMRHESVRLGRLVQELIELSRLEGAEPLPGNDAVDLATVIEEAVDRTRLAADRLGVTLSGQCADGLAVRGNERQLVTAVANLLDNAVAYSPRDTRVTVTARVSGDDVEIAVADQGIGIAVAEQRRIFERFYRVDPARSRATGGTGLGLAIVKHIVANHGGTVSVWSAEGAGSTFTVRLPSVHLAGPSSPLSLAKGAPGE